MHELQMMRSLDKGVVMHIQIWKQDINLTAGNTIFAANNPFAATAELPFTIAQCKKECKTESDQGHQYSGCDFEVEEYVF